MLILEVPSIEMFDEANEQFINTKPVTLRMEHSLVSIAKWEAKWHKPFLSTSTKKKTNEQLVDYMRMMTITQHVDPNLYYSFTNDLVRTVTNYINDPMTATVFLDEHQRPPKEVITAEIIYYWMISFQIPFDCQKWHINRLLTLIKVCSLKSQKPKKLPRAEALRRRHELNLQRREMLNSAG